MSNIYIEDRNGIKYHFNRLSFQQIVDYQAILLADKDNQSEMIKNTLEVFKAIFKESNPTFDMETYDEEILNYNLEEIGSENLLLLINKVIEQAFHTTGANTSKYSFLADLKQE